MFLVTIEYKELRMQMGSGTQSITPFSPACQATSQGSLVYTQIPALAMATSAE